MINNPKVSVIIPVYNVEKYLKECLDSIVNQTLKDIEIICVNDGSTDNSLKIIKDFAQIDNRIVIINQQNFGVSSARNQGIKKAIGEYIIFVDSDDWLELNCIEELVKNTFNNDTDILCFGINCYNNGSTFQRSDINILNQYYTFNHLSIDITKNLIQNVWGKLFKREFLLKYDIKFPENIVTCEDGLFCLFCLYEEPKIKLLNKCLYNYRINRLGSACSKQDTIVKTDIEAFKYILSTENFKKAKNEYKIITIEKFLQHFEWNDTPKYRLLNYLRINQFEKYLYKNVSQDLLSNCDIKNFKKYNIYKLILKNIFSICNTNDKNIKS